MIRKLRVRVTERRGNASVVLRRRFSLDGLNDIDVCQIDLRADDAEERLAEARMRARDLANQLNALESA